MKRENKKMGNGPVIVFVLLSLLVLCLDRIASGQPELPAKTIEVTKTQALQFGDVSLTDPGATGTVTVDYNGTRNYEGNTVLLENMGGTYCPAIFGFKLCPGRTVNIEMTPVSLTNGGYSIDLSLTGAKIGTNTYESVNGAISCSFQSNTGCDETHLIYIGGSIPIGPLSSTPAGTYTGEIEITISQQ